MLYNGKMDIETVKAKIIEDKWQINNVPEQHKNIILTWLKKNRSEIVKIGWPPHPNLDNSINKLTTTK